MINETHPSAGSIDDVVRAVSGVTSVYPELPGILGLPTPIADLARGVAEQLGEPTVRIRIAIADSDASRAVCERVHAVVLNHLLQQAPAGTSASELPLIAVSVVAIG